MNANKTGAHKRALYQLLLWACCCGASLALAGEKAVHLRGTDALLPMAQYMAETYMRDRPGSTIVVGAGGTFRGYKSLLDGTTDIAMVSSNVQENVADLLTKDSPKFNRTIVGYTAIVPVVHPDNALRDLSMVQLRDVFSGHIRNWKELGGKDASIVTLVGPPTDGLTATWREMVLGSFYSYDPKGVVTDAEERLRQVARNPSAISFISFADLNAHVRSLSVDLQKPSADTVRDGSYPLSAPLMLVTLPTASVQTRQFVNYFSTPNKRLRLPGIITAETLD
jgi:phosphate transport system substrate-binding protein